MFSFTTKKPKRFARSQKRTNANENVGCVFHLQTKTFGFNSVPYHQLTIWRSLRFLFLFFSMRSVKSGRKMIVRLSCSRSFVDFV